MSSKLPTSTFPTTVWDGKTPNKENVYDDVDPEFQDLNRLITEVLVIQNHLLGAVTIDVGVTSILVGGASASVGFYGTTPIALQTGVAVTAGGIHAALVALGLITA